MPTTFRVSRVGPASWDVAKPTRGKREPDEHVRVTETAQGPHCLVDDATDCEHAKAVQEASE